MLAGPGTRAVAVTYDDAGRAATWTVGGGSATALFDPATGLESPRRRIRTASAVAYGTASGTPVSLTWTGPLAEMVLDTLDANGRPASEAVDGVGWALPGSTTAAVP